MLVTKRANTGKKRNGAMERIERKVCQRPRSEHASRHQAGINLGVDHLACELWHGAQTGGLKHCPPLAATRVKTDQFDLPATQLPPQLPATLPLCVLCVLWGNSSEIAAKNAKNTKVICALSSFISLFQTETSSDWTVADVGVYRAFVRQRG
jgi:hypothetical protein